MTGRSLEEMIFSEKSKGRVREAVRKAVDSANEAGLRPAYEPAFSQLKELERMADEGGLNLEFHRALAAVLYGPEQPGTWLRQQALDVLKRWDIDNVYDVIYTAKWREWLGLPAELGMTALLSEDSLGTSMRCISPFVFLISR